MYIGKAAQLAGTTIKAIRHYEAIGLLPPPQRQGAIPGLFGAKR